MSIRVALHHKTTYEYDRLVSLSPQVVRLRPAPHCRTPIHAYSLKIGPSGHFLNWQQDPQSNYLARVVFPENVPYFCVEVDLVAEMRVINPFDFFLEPYADQFPFEYPPELAKELAPFLEKKAAGPRLASPRAGLAVLAACLFALAGPASAQIHEIVVGQTLSLTGPSAG
ncbi:MAG: hypothetical protein JNL62_19970, partial [Bryobacterales bacterium]|nr:hypothetical protein [Bryobacterales bacterium]